MDQLTVRPKRRLKPAPTGAVMGRTQAKACAYGCVGGLINQDGGGVVVVAVAAPFRVRQCID